MAGVNTTRHLIGNFSLDNDPFKYVQLRMVRTQTELGAAYRYEVRISDDDSIKDHTELSKSEALQLFYDAVANLTLQKLHKLGDRNDL